MKVLLTGGLGFLGSHLINKLNDHEFFVLDKETYASHCNPISGEYRWFKGDVCNPLAVEEFIGEVDEVWHWAAESFVGSSTELPFTFTHTNIIGTQVILEACVKHKKPLVFKSTDEVLGSLPLEDNGERWNDDSPIDPKNIYAATKASAELLVRAYMNVHKLPAKIIRCCNVYGPGQHREKFIPKAINAALNKEPIVLYPDGKQSREWIYVDDYVRGIETIVSKGEWGETYNLSTGDCWQNQRMVQVILNLVNDQANTFDYWHFRGSVAFKDERPGHDERYHMESFKVEDLGWEQAVSMEKGLKETINWYA